MKKTPLVILLFLSLLVTWCFAQPRFKRSGASGFLSLTLRTPKAVPEANSTSPKIALTFDDAPTGDGYYTGSERTRLLIEKLEKARVPRVAFFCVSSGIDSAGTQRLLDYAAARHIIANHSHSHQRITSLGLESYIADIFKADSVLSNLPGFRRWYRFPFLDEGQTKSHRDALRAALRENHYANGYVTVDNYDWYLNRLLLIAIRENRGVDLDKLRTLYLRHIWDSIAFYDKLARETLGRSPKHVLLLHENDLAALFIDDLIRLIRSHGWRIISPEEAYQDPIASIVPDVLMNNQGRVAAIAREKGFSGPFSQETEDTDFLDRLLEEQKVFGPAPQD